MKNKKIIVTGASGFIGTNLVNRLLKEGNIVFGIDNYCTGREKNTFINTSYSPKYNFIRGDARKAAEIIQNHKDIDEVYHAASPASPPRYDSLPFQTIEVNTSTVHEILWSIQRHSKNTKFLFFSTSEVYGDPEITPQSESYTGNINNTGPRSIYDNAKRMGETITYEHYRRFGTNTKIVRISNTYGPFMDPEDGRVITNFVKQAVLNEPYTIYGDGSQTRSLCYIDDLVEGLILLMNSEGYHEPVNLGNDKELSILNIAKIIHDIVNEGKEFKTVHKPLPKDDPRRRCLDLSLAKKLLNYSPSVTNEEGLKVMVNYIKKELFGDSYDK